MTEPKQRLINVLSAALPGIDFEANDALVDDGLIDSFAIVSIIGALSMEYGINIPFDELESKNFNSVDEMLKLIERCKR